MIEWSLAAFRACEAVRSIVVAAPPGDVRDLGEDARIVAGGSTRTRSVAAALEAVETELVAVHDAARPLLTPELVEDLVARLDAHVDAAGAIAAAPVTDTIKAAAMTSPASDSDEMSDAGLVVEQTVDRSRLWAAQTPQVFRTQALREALVEAEARDEATDEAMLVEAAGGKVLIHPSSPSNFKVTMPLDLKLAELLLGERAAGSVPE
jgi:2-C-methyl-D-erythritol 4-phosphate cytidylyltransferase